MKLLPSIIIIFFATVVFTTSCEESLPTREEIPVKLFETIFQTADSGTTFTFTRDPANINSEHPPPLVYNLQLINIFDETLQGLADSINGTFDIWLAEDPSVGQTFVLSQISEFPPTGIPSHIDSSYITLDPGDTFYIQIEWPHETDDSVKIWDYFGLKAGDTLSVKINALAKLQLFPSTQHIITEIFILRAVYIKIS